MKPIFVLRLMLVLAIVLAVGAGICDALIQGAVPPESREAFRALLASRHLDPGVPGAIAAVIYELAVLASAIGMALLRRWGFPLGLAMTVATMFQAFAFGPHAYSGLAFMLSYASKVAWGAALALAFVLRDPAVFARGRPGGA